MSNHVKGKVIHSYRRTWNIALADVKRQIVLAKRRVAGLEKTLENWAKLRDEGIPWPGAVVQESDRKARAKWLRKRPRGIGHATTNRKQKNSAHPGTDRAAKRARRKTLARARLGRPSSERKKKSGRRSSSTR